MQEGVTIDGKVIAKIKSNKSSIISNVSQLTSTLKVLYEDVEELTTKDKSKLRLAVDILVNELELLPKLPVAEPKAVCKVSLDEVRGQADKLIELHTGKIN